MKKTDEPTLFIKVTVRDKNLARMPYTRYLEVSYQFVSGETETPMLWHRTMPEDATRLDKEQADVVTDYSDRMYPNWGVSVHVDVLVGERR